MRNLAVLLPVFVFLLLSAGCSSDSGVTDPGDGSDGGDGGVADTLAPVINITSPAEGSGLPSFLDIAGTVTDDTEVDTVFFEARDLCGLSLWSAHDLTPPYTATWDASGEQDGEYRVCMAAVDTAGNMSDWVCVNVTKGTSPAPAEITGFLPVSAYIGSSIKAVGTGFGTDTGTGRVIVFGREATVEEWSDTEVTFIIPSGVPVDASFSMELLIDCRWRVTGTIEVLPNRIVRLTNDGSLKEQPCWAGNSTIYFCSTKSGNWDVWRMDADGSDWEQVTQYAESDFTPDIDPSTGEMAWASERGVEGSYDIYHGFLLCGQGGGCWEAPITADNDDFRAPAYANQVYMGYSLVYCRWYDPDDNGWVVPTIFLYGSTSGHTYLTGGDNPAFTYNGHWVVYQDNNYQICRIPTGGGTPDVLTTGFGDFNPHVGWANDRIVFTRNGLNGYRGLCTMNLDGTDFEVLLDQRWDQYDAAWSPDCSKIVFTGHRAGYQDIYIYEVP